MQRRVLTPILGGLGDTAIEVVRLEEWADEGEGDERRTPAEVEASRGVAMRLVRPDPPTIRTRWEVRLAALAFRARSKEEGLRPVVWLWQPGEGTSLSFGAWPYPSALTEREVDELRADLTAAAATAGAAVDALDILRPYAHASAIRLRVREPHAFLRHGLRGLLESLRPWRDGDGRHQFLEVHDEGGRSVLVLADAGVREVSVPAHLACCDPFGLYTRAIGAPPRPSCPIFG